MRSPRKARHRLFLDANVLFSAAYREGAGVARLWELEDVVLLTSEYALEEARRNLASAAQQDKLDKLAGQLEVSSTLASFSLPPEALLPPKDAPILAAALAARASHLITGDHRHFGRYFGKTVAGVVVLPPGRYLAGGE